MKIIIEKIIYGGMFIDKYFIVVRDTKNEYAEDEHIQVSPEEWEKVKIYDEHQTKEK